MTINRDFLKLILPSEGWYCCAVFGPKVKRQKFVYTIDQLARLIEQEDKNFVNSNVNVYHGCAAYSDKRRLQSDVKKIKAFWLDVDCGNDGHAKPDYKNINDAIEALKAFCCDNELPDPTVVGSGNGIHIYWPLDTEIDPSTWKQYTAGLKSLCQRSNFYASPERTNDCSSILRTPGTVNRKTTPKRVFCGPLNGPYNIERFKIFVSGPFDSAELSGILVRPTYLNGNEVPWKNWLLTNTSNIDIDVLTKICNQLNVFKQSNGCIKEPEWYAGLGVLAWIEGGNKLAHQWSSGYAKYTYEETERRLERVRGLTGPTTCNHFMNINPLGCENCSAKGSIKTPLEIGKKYRNENILVPDTHDDKNGAALPGHSEYVLKDGALYFAHDNPNGAPTYTKISSYQVKIQSLHVGEVKNNQNYVLLRHYKPHTGWHEAELKASELLGDKTVAIMADLGSVIHDRIHFQMYVRDSIDYLRQKQKEEMQYEQFGWKNSNKSFLYGDTLYSSNSIATTAINQDLRFRAQWLCPVAGGSVEKWKDAVDCLFGRGSEGMSFTILASFASVLMRFLEENEGGAIVSLMTRHSGAGKTTTLSGAYTVWASNMHALGLTTIDTKVAKSLSLGALGNLPAFYDEFTDKDPEVIKNFIEMFTNGRDKKRGTSSGELQNSLLTWQMLLISAGNQSLVDTIRSTGKSEAPSMRILEFGVESSGDMLQSRLMALAKQLHANAGHAGAEYLKYLIQPGTLEVIYYQLPRIIDEIMKNCSFQKQHRFWARTLAAVGMAAKIVDKLNLISFSPERIMEWAQEEFSTRASSEAVVDMSMYPVLADFLNHHIDETLLMPTAAQGRREIPHIGDLPKKRITIRIELDSQTCIVNETTLRSWMEKNSGGGYGLLMKELAKNQHLKFAKKQVTLGAGTIASRGQVYCLAFDMGAPAFTGIIRSVNKVAKHEADIQERIIK